MSRISNLKTIRIGIFNSWNSYWFDSYYYSYLLFNDLKLKDYFASIFYKLRIISDYLHIYRFADLSILFKTSLIFLDNIKFQSISIKNIKSLDKNYELFYDKKSWRNFLSFLKLIYLSEKKQISILVSNDVDTLCFFSELTFLYENIICDLPRKSYCINNNMYSLLYNLYSSKDFISRTKSDITLKTYCALKELLPTSGTAWGDLLYNLNYLKGCSSTSLCNNEIVNSHSLIYKKYMCSEKEKKIKSFFYYINFIFNDMGYRDKLYNAQSLSSLINLKSHTLSIFMNLIFILKYVIHITLLHLNTNIGNIILLLKSVHSIITSDINVDYISISKPISNKLLLIYGIRENVTKHVFHLFKSKIESTVQRYEHKDVYFYFSLFLKKLPFISSAKVITDLIAYLLESGNKIVKSFFFIYNLQSRFFTKKRKLEYLYHSQQNKYKDFKLASRYMKYLYHYAFKHYPLIGIRIECTGSFKKGKRSRVYYYTSWIKNQILTGAMPNNTIIADIDYYQYFITLKSSSIGIKTWIFLETYIYNSNNIYIGIIY